MRRMPLFSPEGEATGSSTQNNPAPAERLAEVEAQAAAAIARYRNVIAGGPDIIAEMVGGSTLAEIDASAETARQAYANISRQIAQAHESAVPTGNPARSSSIIGAESLKPEAKIAMGLRGK
ncbi:MAG: hypothetical protein ABI670_19460 [Chloroflexota bacterium]